MSQKKLKEKTRTKKEEAKAKKNTVGEVESVSTNITKASDAEGPIAPEPEPQRNSLKISGSKKRKHEDFAKTEEAVVVPPGEENKAKRSKSQDLSSNRVAQGNDVGKEGNNHSQHAQVDSVQSRGSGTKATQRFIVFVGNLPYSATTESIQKHFAALAPFTVRLSTDKQTKKPKGFAFLEFQEYDRMKTCLKLYHHSSFDNGKNQSRKINVELTAGGGGMSDNRKAKLKEKNERLTLQRRRRMDQEAQRKKKKSDEGAGDGIKSARKLGLEKDETDATPRQDTGGIHPSRLARIKA